MDYKQAISLFSLVVSNSRKTSTKLSKLINFGCRFLALKGFCDEYIESSNIKLLLVKVKVSERKIRQYTNLRGYKRQHLTQERFPMAILAYQQVLRYLFSLVVCSLWFFHRSDSTDFKFIILVFTPWIQDHVTNWSTVSLQPRVYAILLLFFFYVVNGK